VWGVHKGCDRGITYCGIFVLSFVRFYCFFLTVGWCCWFACFIAAIGLSLFGLCLSVCMFHLMAFVGVVFWWLGYSLFLGYWAMSAVSSSYMVRWVRVFSFPYCVFLFVVFLFDKAWGVDVSKGLFTWSGLAGLCVSSVGLQDKGVIAGWSYLWDLLWLLG